MFGLTVSLPSDDAAQREALTELLHQQMIPVAQFTEDPASGFDDAMSVDDFLRTASATLLMPGMPIPASLLMRYCSQDAKPGNAIRRYLYLQFSLLPAIRADAQVTQYDGCHMLGHNLLIVHLDANHVAHTRLPNGDWTDLMTGAVYHGMIHECRSINAMPVLVRENTLLPIGVNDRTADANDADRVTLHWCQPAQEAYCTLADGTAYRAFATFDGCIDADAETTFPWHLIVHQDGDETFVR